MAFDPDAYLKTPAAKPAAFDPDAYLGAKPSAPVKPAQEAKPPGMKGILDLIMGGPESAANLVTSAVAKPVADVMGMAAMGRDALRDKPEGNAGAFRDDMQRAMTYEPRTASGQAFAKYNPLALVGQGVNAVGRGAEQLIAPPGAGTGRQMVGAGIHEALNQAPGFMGVKAGSAADMLAPAFVGAGEKAMIPVRAAGKAVAADSDTLALARKAQEQGIPLRPDMLSKNKFARMAGEASEQVPFSGSQAKVRQEAFNKALIRQIGGDEKASRLTPDVFQSAMNKSGKTIGDISERTPVKSFQPKLQEFLKDNETQTADVRNSLDAYAREIETQTRNGVIDGTAYKRINSKISRQLRSTSNGDLKNSLSDLQDLMHNELQANVTKMSDLKQLQEARAMYSKGKTLEPLVAKSADGHISPAGLMGRVTANGQGKTNMAMGRGGDMGDLARIGQRFLKEPNSSGTAERGAVYGALAGGSAIHPAVAAGAVAGANLYNRMGPSLVKRILGDDIK